ncbi:putative paraoxonase [Xylaria bambusicola]|uniref:putative paraoxonase n=1 Tax=Xylaria bambusicola TaxID=326684 RepID=UPI002007448E|nr:putative paraoxonase [Xylaria bambusicola]KAI0512963.1 putative paraoxonase [Xylaria bambusicola]
MAFNTALGVILLALLSPFIYERAQTLSLFFSNAPHRLVKVNTFASHEVRFADRIRSCEDVLLVESKGIAIAACDPGRERYNTVMGMYLPEPVENGKLYIFDYTTTGASGDEALKQLDFVDFKFESDFHTLGMAYDEATSTLFVANHRHDHPAVEMFLLDLEGNTATHLRSIQHPLIHGPNSIALINDHELYVTNDHFFVRKNHSILHQLETYLGAPGGNVVHVDFSPIIKDPAAPVQASVVARVAFANGIELLNETTAVIASSGKATVHFFSITTPENNDTPSSPVPKFTQISKIRVPFAPDNLAVSKDGALIIAGHPHFPSLGAFTKTRHICNSPEELAKADEGMQETCRTLLAPSWAAKWTEAGGLETLYADVEYPSSATAARDSDRKMGVISGLYAKGILVWKE